MGQWVGYKHNKEGLLLLNIVLIRMSNQYKCERKVIMDKISQGMNIGWFNLHNLHQNFKICHKL